MATAAMMLCANRRPAETIATKADASPADSCAVRTATERTILLNLALDLMSDDEWSGTRQDYALPALPADSVMWAPLTVAQCRAAAESLRVHRGVTAARPLITVRLGSAGYLGDPGTNSSSGHWEYVLFGPTFNVRHVIATTLP